MSDEKLIKRLHDRLKTPQIFKESKIEDTSIYIAVTDTTSGPGLGGVRWNIYNSQEEAKNDCLKLSLGMHYKWIALRQLLDNKKLFTGGKAVINDPNIFKTIKKDANKNQIIDTKRLNLLFERFGEFVNSMNGTYYTAPDMNTDVDIMSIIKRKTDFVKCLPGETGDPSPTTAKGVFIGIKELSKYSLNKELDDLTIWIQGVGKVGSNLIKFIREQSNKTIIYITESEIERAKIIAKRFNCIFVEENKIPFKKINVFSPNARGGTVNKEIINKLNNNSLIAGGANNQINTSEEEIVFKLLTEKNITYAPDYYINMGGICNVVFGKEKNKINPAMKIIDGVGKLLIKIVEQSKIKELPTAIIADKICDEYHLKELKNKKSEFYEKLLEDN